MTVWWRPPPVSIVRRISSRLLPVRCWPFTGFPVKSVMLRSNTLAPTLAKMSSMARAALVSHQPVAVSPALSTLPLFMMMPLPVFPIRMVQADSSIAGCYRQLWERIVASGTSVKPTPLSRIDTQPPSPVPPAGTSASFLSSRRFRRGTSGRWDPVRLPASTTPVGAKGFHRCPSPAPGAIVFMRKPSRAAATLRVAIG